MPDLNRFEGVINLGEISLFASRSGGPGPDLIVIHGGPDWDHSYIRAFMQPAESFANLLFFDIRGCGKSQQLLDVSELHVSKVVRDISALMRHFGLASSAMLGFSFGGRVGLEFIDQCPDVVNRFVLASSSAYPRSSKEQAAIANLSTCETVDDVRAQAQQSIELNIHRKSARAAARKAIEKVRFSNQWLRALRSGNSISFPEKDYSGRLLKSRIPTLALHGECDHQFPVYLAQRLAADVPSVKLVAIKEAGHFTHMDAPEEWNRHIKDFLRSP